MALSNRKVLLFKLEEGLEVNLIGRNFTVWGEIREPFKLLLGRECLCKFFCFVLLLCVSVCLCVCMFCHAECFHFYVSGSNTVGSKFPLLRLSGNHVCV